MKNKYLLPLALLLGICKLSTAQQLVSAWYTFTTSTSTYAAITGSTLGTSSNNDDTFDNVPLGFTFNFAQTNLTAVSVNANGYIKMGATLNNYSFDPIDDPGGDDSLICALGSDIMSNATGVLSYTTTGTAPNRIFTVQWSNYTSYGGTDNLNFQIKLYETSNKIDVIYGTMTPSQYSSSEIGLRGSSPNDFNNRSVLNGNNTWAASVAGASNTDYCELDPGPPVFKPASGRKYTWNPPPACTGTPTAGTATAASGSLACTGQSLSIGVTGGAFASGLSYQWQSSPNGTTWTSIPSATNASYGVNYASTIYYRRIIGCSTNTAVSIGATVTTIASLSYAPLPFLENFNNTWQSRCDLRNVPTSTFWTSNPTTSDSSWRRQNDGASANWTDLPNGVVTPLAGAGCADFHSEFAAGGTRGDLELGVNMGTTLTNILSFYHINQDGDDSLELFLSTNAGSSFTKKAVFFSGDYNPADQSWNKKILNLGVVNSASCIVRFRGNSDFGSTDIGMDSLKIATLPACTGTPSAGTSTVNATVLCTGQTVSLTINGGSAAASNLTYQWQSSPNGTTWSSVPSATNVSYITTFTSNIYYRRLMTCVSATAASNALNLLPTPSVSYAPVPFVENFDNTWQNRCDVKNVPRSAFWSSNPTTSDSSWRRQDNGVSANWQNATIGTVSPFVGIGCADFHSYYAPFGSTGELDLYLNMNALSTYTLFFYHTNYDGDDSLEVFFSTDGGSTFAKKKTFVSGDYNPADQAWNKKTINLGAISSPSCVVRFKATSDYGNSDIGMDSLKVIATCITPTAVTIVANPGGSGCAGTSVTLTASGANTYSWSTSATTATIAVSPTVSTSYTVTGSNGAGCAMTQTIALGVNANPTISISASSSTLCPGSTVSLTASGGISYLWNTSATTTIIAVNPTVTATYTVTGTNASNCSNTKTISLTVKATPTLTVSASSYSNCSGKSLTLTAGGAVSYSWTSGANTASYSITPQATQVYTVTGSNTFGCTGSNTIQVVVSPSPTVSVANTTICAGGAAILTAFGANTYSWSTSATSSVITVSPASNTTYTVAGFTGFCSDTKTVSVTIGSNLLVNIAASSTAICSGSSATLTALGASNYTWSTSSLSNSVVVTPTGNSTTYTVDGSSGTCFGTASISISTIPNPTVTVSDVTVCPFSVTTLTASGAGSYSWGASGSGSLITVIPFTDTSYVVVGTLNGCTDTEAVNVSLSPGPTNLNIIVTNTAICLGNATGLLATGATNYTWSTSSNVPVINVSPVQTTTYSVIGELGGCYNTKTVSIAVNPNPTVTIVSSSPTVVCAGDTVVFTAGGALSYTWSTGAGTASYSVAPVSTNTYIVLGSDAAGCIGIDTAVVNVTPLPVLSVSDITLCSAPAGVLSASGANSYSWSTGSTSPFITVSPTSDTTYFVTGTTNGCKSTKAVQVTVGNAVTINILASSSQLCKGDTAILTASGATSYIWDGTNASASLTVSPASTSGYTVMGTNGICSSSQSISVVVNPNPILTISSSSPTICVGNSATLKVSGAFSFSWSTSVTSPSIIVSPSVTTTYMVVGTTTAGCHTSGSIVQNVDLCTGIVTSNPDFNGVSVFPNPNNGSFMIEMSGSTARTIVILDVTGRVVSTLQSEQDVTPVNITELKNGIYFVRIKTAEEGLKTVKIIKE